MSTGLSERLFMLSQCAARMQSWSNACTQCSVYNGSTCHEQDQRLLVLVDHGSAECWQQMAKMASGGMDRGTAVKAVSKDILHSHASSDHRRCAQSKQSFIWATDDNCLLPDGERDRQSTEHGWFCRTFSSLPYAIATGPSFVHAHLQ